MSRAFLVLGLLLVFAGSVAAAAQAPARAAKEYLAAARSNDEQALAAFGSGKPVSAALALLRASQADLAAALDTLGAAELSSETTAAIRGQLVAAAQLKGRVLAARGAQRADPPAPSGERLMPRQKAAALLGGAPGAPSIGELPIPVGVFGAFDLVVGPDGKSVWVSGPDGSRIVLFPSLEPGTTPTVFRLPPGSGPRGITFGPGGALYIAETGTNIGGNAIGRLMPTGELKQFFLPAGAGSPWGIAAGRTARSGSPRLHPGRWGVWTRRPETSSSSSSRPPTASRRGSSSGLTARCGEPRRAETGSSGSPSRGVRPSSRSRRRTACRSPSPPAATATCGCRSSRAESCSASRGRDGCASSRSRPAPARTVSSRRRTATSGSRTAAETASAWSRLPAACSSSRFRRRTPSRPRSPRSGSASSPSPSSSRTRSAS